MKEKVQNSSEASRRRRIQRVAGVMAISCMFLALALAPCMAVVWAYVEHLAPLRLPAALLTDLSIVDRVGGFMLSLLVVGVAIWGLASLAQLFARFRRGDIFDLRNATLLRRFALSVLLLPPANLLTEGLSTAWLSRDAPPGEGMIALSLSSNDLLFGVIGVLLLTIAWVLHEATAISEENKLIV